MSSFISWPRDNLSFYILESKSLECDLDIDETTSSWQSGLHLYWLCLKIPLPALLILLINLLHHVPDYLLPMSCQATSWDSAYYSFNGPFSVVILNQAAGYIVHIYCIDGRVHFFRVQCDYIIYSALQLGNIVPILPQPLQSMLFEFTSVELECTYTVCHNNLSG